MTSSLSDLDLLSPDTYVQRGYPHEAWTRLRREAPVHFMENAVMPYWAVTKHADIAFVGKNPELFLNGPLLVLPTERAELERNFQPPPTLIQLDGAKHTAYRKIISKRFTPGALKKIHADIDKIAKEIVDGLLEQGDEGECDFVARVSAPLPIAVIAWLLGVPKSDWGLLFDWTNRTIGAADPEYQVPGQTPAETAQKAMAELFMYFAKMVEEKRKNPGDDLVSLFVQAEVDGAPLPPLDLLSYCMIVVVAGNETTRNGTSGGMLALIEHPAELAKIQRNPALLGAGIEEMVRWASPIIHFARTATQDVELHGKQIRKGDRLGLFYPSANRDEEVFDAPFTFDVTRAHNRHLAFGIGEHFCAGAHVARLELEMAFKYLLPRIESIEVSGPIERLRSSLVGGVKHLPIRYKLKKA
ncbi:MAG: cytochrome P450 [Myxococcota bacterium]